MRLLERQGDGSFNLTKNFLDGSVAPYAILSHTWGHDSQEVTFEDMVNGSGQNKAGFEKIRFCGEQAARDGLTLFWVDSCCIKKSSDAELSEAINSMFRWYQAAQKCYVYLADVSANELQGVDGDLEKFWMPALRKSRWFARGWTLQELIAPREVEFFSKEGRLLGDKRSLEQVIHETTGIALDALRGTRTLREFSVDERISWIKNRQTTRQEDAAYCLLGIFDIHMPLIYGEGRKKALNRLSKEIQEAQNPAPSLYKESRAVLLPPANDKSDKRSFQQLASSFNDAPVDLLSTHFINRERELWSIRNAHQMNEQNAPARCAVWGIPGVGKTQLAIRYTKAFLEEPLVSAVFWISCSNLEKLHQGFSRILDLIGHPDRFKLDQNARVVAARRWLEQPEASGIQRWLLVLDKVDITALEFFRENLPRKSRRGHILITTRTEAVAKAVCKASGMLQQYFEIEPPEMEEAITFFLKSVDVSEDSLPSNHRRQVTNLVKCLGRLPFAIEHAASFMTQSSQSIDDLMRLYHSDEKAQIFDWENDVLAYESKSVSGLFMTHLHSLRQSNPQVLGLLNILAFWDADTVELDLIKRGLLSLNSAVAEKEESHQKGHWDWFLLSGLFQRAATFCYRNPATETSSLEGTKAVLASSEVDSLVKLVSSEVQFQSALQELRTRSFIKRRSGPEGGACCMHDLTQSWVQGSLELDGTCLQWFRCSANIACGAFRQIENHALAESWHQCESWIPHILSLANYGKSVDPMNSDLLTARTKIAEYWCKRGRYHEAQEAYQQLLDLGSKAPQSVGAKMIQWKLGLADVFWHLNKYGESILLYDEVRQLRETELGANHPDVLDIMEKTALVYRSQGRKEDARSMMERVFDCRKTTLGPNHLDTIRTIENLAGVVTSLGKRAEAESLHKQVLKHLEAQLGPDHLDTLWAADNLATNYREQGRSLEALGLHRRVFEGRTSQLGEEHPQTLFTLANLAMTYTNLGRLDEAEDSWKKAIMGNEQLLGHNHRQTLWAVEGLADVYYQQSRSEDAISLYNRALRGKEEQLGDGHPSVLWLMHKLANHYRYLKNFTQSIELFDTLLERRIAGLRSCHPDILLTYHDVAASYVCLGKYDEAERCYRQELEGSIEEFGCLNPETMRRKQNLASFLSDKELKGEDAQRKVEGNTTNEQVLSDQQSMIE